MLPRPALRVNGCAEIKPKRKKQNPNNNTREAKKK
jgi:hypothetical protein